MSTPTPSNPESGPPYSPPPAPPTTPPYAAGAAYQPPAYPGVTPQYPPPAPQYPGATHPYGGYAPPRPTNSLAIVSLVSSLVGIVFSWTFVLAVGVIVGVITGHMALGQIRRSGDAGRGMALAGVIIGWVSIGLGVLSIVGFIAFWGLFGAASVSYGI